MGILQTLTGLLPSRKAQRNADRFQGATVLPGMGAGPKPRPFRQDLAVRRFSDWVYAGVLLNAQATSAVPLRLYARKRQGAKCLWRTRGVSVARKRYLTGEHRDYSVRPSTIVRQKLAEFGDDFEEVTEPHPALRLLNTVNDWQNGFELSLLKFILLQLAGNYYQHHVMSGPGRTPGELWVMVPHLTKIVPPKNPNDGPVDHYLYGRSEKAKKFGLDEVIWWKLPNPADPYGYGYGKMEACWTAVGLHDAKRVMDQSRYDNMCRPDWIIGLEGAASSALERMEAKLEEKYQGPTNAGKVLAANGKVTAQSLNIPDPEVGDSDNVVREIAAVLGVPLYKLLGDNAIKANSEQQDAGWMRDSILPLLRLDEEQLNAQYLPLWDLGEDAVLAYDNPVPEDRRLELEELKVSVGGPWRKVNEAREQLGLDPIDGGDVLLSPSAMLPMGFPMFAPGAQPSAPAGDTPPAGEVPPGQPVPQGADGPQVGNSQDIQTAEAAVLNGAQITAALSIVQQVAAGDIPRDAGLGMLTVLFNLTPEKAAQLMGSAGTSTPTTPNPNPRLEAEREAEAEAAAAQANERPADASPAPAKGIVEVVIKTEGIKTEGPHSYGCVMADLPAEAAAAVLALGAAIPDEDLAEDGREPEPHATVLYGLHTTNPLDVSKVLAAESPISLTLGKTTIFAGADTGKTYDVVKVSVDSLDLHRLNTKLRKLDHTNSFDYVPHVTLAYVKAGKGQSYEGDATLDGIAVTIDRVVFSDADGNRTEIPLTGKKVAKQLIIKSVPLTASPELTAIVRSVFAEQSREAMANLRKKGAPAVETKDDDRDDKPKPPPDLSLLDLEKWNAELAKRAKPILEKLARQAARELLPKLPKLPAGTFEVVDRSLPQAAEELSLKFAESTNATTTMKLDAARDALRSEIEQGIVTGDHNAEMAKRVQSVFTEASDARAEVIARTEANRVRHDAELRTVKASGVVKAKKWMASPDACEKCEAAAAAGGEGIPLDKAFAKTDSADYGDVQMPPLHPNCFVGETPVLVAGPVRAFVAHYRGPIVRVVLADGRSLTCTPNHLLLTTRGFANAGRLREGDEVIDCRIGQGVGLGNPNDHRKPAPIKQVVASLSEASGMTAGRVPVSPEYLHGDAAFVDSHINVVAADGFLRGDREAAAAKSPGKQDFGGADVSGILFDGEGDFAPMLLALRDAADGGVGGRGIAPAFLRREPLVAEQERFGQPAGSDAGFDQPTADSRSRDAEVDGQGLLRLAGDVPPDHGGHVDDLAAGHVGPAGLGTKCDAGLPEPVEQGRNAYADRLGNLLDRFAGMVTTCKVLDVQRDRFDGHVYDLQTESSLYIANGVVASNCTCSVEYVIDEDAV